MRRAQWLLVAAALAWAAPPGLLFAAARGERGKKTKDASDAFLARRQLRRAKELLELGETERSVRMFETIIEQFPRSAAKNEALLVLGKHFLKVQQQLKAVQYLRRLKGLKKPDEPIAPEVRDLWLESQYLTGVAHFQLKNYPGAFPILRKITKDYPNTIWANQSYYYIGLCHFAQGNWKKAIDALSLVGTFVDPNSPTIQYVESGRRFYIKVTDADLPVLHRLGSRILARAETARGDKETLQCIPLSMRQGIFISSMPTEVGPPRPGDGKLQVIGQDTIRVQYVDDNTKQGRKDVARAVTVKVVSTATARFTTGTFESSADAAFLGQPLFLLLRDTDRDVTDQSDGVTVKLISRYPVQSDESAEPADAGEDPSVAEEEEAWKVRDEITVRLVELGPSPVHSGRFAGRVRVEPVTPKEKIDTKDARFSCALGDEVVLTYVDERHIGGSSKRALAAKINVVGEIDANPRATQNIVPDPVLRARKLLVETTAYLELARIFSSMGLSDGAKGKADEGLRRVEDVIRIEAPIPMRLREEAYRLKWELFMVQKDYARAVATCKLFHRLYPESPFVDQAMLNIGKVRLEAKEYGQAIRVFREILRLKKSLVKAEARFQIASALEAQAEERSTGDKAEPKALEAAVREYKACAEKYPDSAFAGPALAKVVDYHIRTKDYARANDMLEQVFQDYPDGKFLDNMLLQSTLVAYYRKDYRKAYERCTQLIFEYPGSKHSATARKKILPQIQARLKGANNE